jgi:short-subunit dehydrogenase
MKRVVLVTGASSGMGRAISLFLSQEGFLVYAGSRTPNKLPTLKNLKPIFLDITDIKNVEKTLSTIPKIDILINNAGYGLISTVEDVTEEEMIEQFNVNVFGLLRVTKCVIPKMRKQKSGVIINISSFLGKIGLPLLTLYNSSKYAVEGITDSLRYELRDFNIRVHSILPGFFDTEFARKNIVINEKIKSEKSPYIDTISTLLPTLIKQINEGNDVARIAQKVFDIIEDENFYARQTAGDKAKKFIPMKQELSDEDFERRVREYYNL